MHSKIVLKCLQNVWFERVSRNNAKVNKNIAFIGQKMASGTKQSVLFTDHQTPKLQKGGSGHGRVIL